MSASSSAIRTRRGTAASVSVVGPVMTDILSCTPATSDLGGGQNRSEHRSSMVGGCFKVGGRALAFSALVSQLAEETDSKPVQCGFESHRGHQLTARFRVPGRR